MPDEEFEALKEDIRVRGVLQRILVKDGLILDGRHRWEACQSLGIECPTRDWEGDGSLVDLVMALNAKRRHLTPSLLATVAVAALPFLEAEARERQRAAGGDRRSNGSLSARVQQAVPKKGKAAEHAASRLGIGARIVYEAKKISERAPERFEAIRRGDKTVGEVMRELNRAERHEAMAPAPDLAALGKRYSVIYADPPWRYDHPISDSRRIENQYPTMTEEELSALDVQSLSSDDAVLFLWSTSPKLREAIALIEAWGFRYRTCCVWDKERLGMGHMVRQRHELLLVATKGSPPMPAPADRPASVLREPRGRHSQKPETMRTIIERMYPKAGRLELFARSRHEGWDAWGNEVEAVRPAGCLEEANLGGGAP